MVSVNQKILVGMTNDELELACEGRDMRAAPWVHWTAEIYSFGKCIRFWTKYPNFLPLFVYSDHGVGLPSHLRVHELENQAKVHFTCNPMKALRNKDHTEKKVIQIIHPWISYRRLTGISRSKASSGTLVFFSHGTPDVKWVGHDTEEYFEKLRELPSKFQPVVLCLHMHDIRAGLHKELRRYGFPIVTAGNTLTTDFVDRFYNLVKDYSYATSQTWGSQVAYCVELGIPYFFFGERPRLINISDKDLPEGEAPRYWDKFHEVYAKRAEELFRMPVDSVTDEQKIFVESILGLDSTLTRRQVAWILWREFFRNWRQWPEILTTLLVKFSHRILQLLGMLEVAKGIRQRFKS